MGRRFWTEPEDDFLKKNRAMMSTGVLADLLGRPKPSVRVRVRQLGLTNEAFEAQKTRRAAINHNYFSKIDSPMKAYILGWLASDGYVSSRWNEIGIKLHMKDSDAVRLIRDELAPLHNLSNKMDGLDRKTPMVLFRVSSPQMKSDLQHLEVTVQKSLTLQYPSIPSEFDNSFILGCFDGDGCLTTYKPNRNSDKRYFRWQLTSASVPFLCKVQEKVLSSVDVQLHGPYSSNRSKARVITCYGDGLRTVDAWLHADLPGLARKSLAHRGTTSPLSVLHCQTRSEGEFR